MTSHFIQLFEFGAYHSLPDDIDLHLFKTYLIEVWNNRQLFYDHVEENEADTEDKQADIRRQGQALLQFDGRYIRARNYAGFIQYQGTIIHILPKIFSGTGMPQTKIIEHLLFYLSYASPMRFPFTEQNTDAAYHDNFLQILIHFFAVLTEKTLAAHPYHTYEEVSEQSAFVRGRLDMGAYTRQSLRSGQWQELQVQHSPFVYDNVYNQVVKYTAQLLIPVASARSLPLLHEILFILHEVSDNRCSYQDCEKPALTHLPPEHKQVLSLCKLFLANQQITSIGSQDHNFSFLVPMERVFEDFTGGFLKKHFPELIMQLQPTTTFATLNGQAALYIRNDIWLPQSIVVIDTKYKLLDLHSDDSKKGVLQSDLYQMLAYAIRRKSTQVHLIYPGTARQPQESIVYQIEDAFSGGAIQIHIHQIPMINYNDTTADSSFTVEELVVVLKEKFHAILYHSL